MRTRPRSNREPARTQGLLGIDVIDIIDVIDTARPWFEPTPSVGEVGR